jgi:hypothetical protein
MRRGGSRLRAPARIAEAAAAGTPVSPRGGHKSFPHCDRRNASLVFLSSNSCPEKP